MAKKKTMKQKAWEAFSLYIRARDANSVGECKCCTCGKVLKWKGDGMQSGHYVSSRNNTVLLDERLVHPQCYHCNIGLQGNKHKYTFFMLDKGYTIEELKDFVNLKNKTKIVKDFEWEELRDMYREKSSYIIQEKGLE